VHGFCQWRSLPSAGSGHGAVGMQYDDRTQWVREPAPTTERLDRLSPDEAELYAGLVTDSYGPAVRLEQERVRLSLLEGL
jgi:hypothetical protein